MAKSRETAAGKQRRPLSRTTQGRFSTRCQALVEVIADDIVRGRLAPGTRLTEADLARYYGMSRTPVREAIRELGAMGFIEKEPNRRMVVTNLTADAMQELFEAVAMLEATCAKLAAERMTDAERQALIRLHESCGTAVQNGDGPRYAELNRSFHRAIYRGAHNEVFGEMVEGARKRLAPFRRAQLLEAGRTAESLMEHDAIVDKILRRDGEAAYRATLVHYRQIAQRAEEVLRGE